MITTENQIYLIFISAPNQRQTKEILILKTVKVFFELQALFQTVYFISQDVTNIM
jgi:hypothetical protein